MNSSTQRSKEPNKLLIIILLKSSNEKYHFLFSINITNEGIMRVWLFSILIGEQHQLAIL